MASFVPRAYCLLIASILFGGMISTAGAEVRMPAIFGDHMVLQEQAKLPIWGFASPGETVRVTFRDQTKTTVCSQDGTWRVDLEPVAEVRDGATLTIAGKKNKLVFNDVLVGDVWITSGQSNMEFGIQTDKRGQEAISTANDPELRFFFVPWATALQPKSDVGPITPASQLNGKWIVCSPSVLSANWAWHGFSAVGYYFARDIRQATGHPVGMIATYKGGTPAQAWTSISGLQQEAALAHYVDDHQKILDDLTTAEAAYPKKHADYELMMKAWQEAKKRDPTLAANTAPKDATSPDGGYSAPANLFNGMVAPLIPYAIKGVIWYQGESNGNNVDQGVEYNVLFPRMISDWRDKWGQGDFPFLFVQLPNINALAKVPSEGNWPWVREAQLKASMLPNAGMAVAIDLGEAENLHPTDKLYVGKRLALVGLHVAYGQSVAYSGPIYDSMKIEGEKIRLSFKNVGRGLRIGVPPPDPDGKQPATPQDLTGFGIAGEDGNFVWAKATLDGDTVVVSADEVDHPVAVRYDWGQNPSGDLYNQDNLPASPFRTDDWQPPLTPKK